MLHSPHASVDSSHTFDLEQPDRTDSAVSNHTMKRHSRPASGLYGVAVTSESENVRTDSSLSQQQERDREEQEHKDAKRSRRRSTPGTAGDYAAAAAKAANTASLVVPTATDDERSQSFNNDSRRRGQYYADEVHYKEQVAKQTRERMQRQAPVIAELKTNVIIKDEFTLVTDLSYQLAQRYTRPDSSIMIKVDHSACLAMGGTFDPCYLLTINAVPSQMGPSTNKRNAALIQAFMADILSVPAARGIVTFTPIPEECLATGGNTLQGDVDKAEKEDSAVVRKSANEPAKKPVAVKKTQPKPYTEDKALLPNPMLEKKPSSDSIARTINIPTERPKTAHTVSSPAVNGLRMNPISPGELTSSNAPLPNGRPRSIGAPERAASSQPTNLQPIPNVTKQITAKAPGNIRATTKADAPAAKARHILVDAKRTSPNPLAPRPVQLVPKAYNSSAVTPFTTASTTSTKVSGPPMDEEKRSKAVYLDMITALPPKADMYIRSDELNPVRTNSDSDASATSQTTAAETAPAPESFRKRRSATLTTTPKMPPLPPPSPTVDREESKSLSSRLSKRKSFMRMFKRESAVPAWYKQ